MAREGISFNQLPTIGKNALPCSFHPHTPMVFMVSFFVFRFFLRLHFRSPAIFSFFVFRSICRLWFSVFVFRFFFRLWF